MGGHAEREPAQRSPLYPVTSKLIRDEWEKLRRNKITPWAFLNSGKPVRIVNFHGKEMTFGGILFEGSPRAYFWGRYIEPFLEDIAFRMIDRTLDLCREKGQRPKSALLETGELLKRLVRDAYEAMADVDQRLRGGGYPDRVGKRSVEDKVAAMAQFIDLRVAGELRMWRRPGWLKEFYHEHPFLFWFLPFLVTIIFGVLALW